MKLSQKLSLSSGFLTLLVAAGVIVGMYSMKRIYGSAEGLTGYSVPGIIESLRIDTIVSDITLNTIRHVYTETDDGMRRREVLLDGLTKRLAETQQRYNQSIQDPENRRLWDAYMALSRELAALRGKALELSKQQKTKEALEILDGPYVDTYYRMSEALNKVVTLNVQEVDSDSNDIIAVINGTNTFLTALLIVSVLLSAGASFLLIRSVMRDTGKDPGELATLAQRVSHGDYNIDDGSPRIGLYGHILAMITTIKDSMGKAEEQSAMAQGEASRAREAMAQAEEAGRQAQTKTTAMLAAANRLEEIASIVSSASAELAAQIEQSERGASEQAARVTETAAAMEEMNSTVLEVARNAGQAADVSTSTRQKAEAGAQVVRRSVDSIQVVQKQAVRLKGDMTRLDENAKAISQIMSVISDIADQTNLLALNAAIEAARAGDAGRGFAVVADEVRKLAEKTMASTTDVGAAIKAIQQSVAESLTQVDASVNAIEEATGFANESGVALTEIVTMVDQAADQVRAIATASEQQSATSEEINRSVAHVNTIAAETARAMAEAARAVSELASQSQVLANLIDEMKRV